MLTDTRKSPFAKVRPISANDISWDENSFWGECFHTVADNTVPHIMKLFEDEDISHVVENFRIAAFESGGKHKGTPFGDGDFYKWMEAAIYAAAKKNDSELFKKLENYIALIGKAQQADGYISTKQIIGERDKSGVSRLGDINDFEVYNFGHLFTTACIYKRITGKYSFLNIAVKAADFLDKLYSEAAKTGVVKTAVCPSHYMGLIEIYRTTGDKKYLDLAALSISLRDSVKNGTDDNQDRLPLKQHDKIKGHAVRSNYLYAGVADLYAETGDEEYKAMLDKVWKNLVEQKIYITGGCGALYNGTSPYGNFWIDQKVHQAFGYEYQLPNITAYNETCASIGNVFWAYRMFNIEPKAEYFDVIERAMFNVNLASISLDGKKFFYENMLRRAKKLPYELCWPLERKEYISSFCCPPNITRLLAQTCEYAYAVSQNEIFTGLYGASVSSFRLDNGCSFTLKQETAYPWDGLIKFRFEKVEGEAQVTLNIRIPYWAEGGFIKLKSNAANADNQFGTIAITKKIAGSYVKLPVSKPSETEIEVLFEMNVRLTAAHVLVEENTNQVAVERGPLVYCIESADIESGSLDGIMLDTKLEFENIPYEIGGRKMVALSGFAHKIVESPDESLYRTFHYRGTEKVKIRMIPYFAWDNRGFGEMKIWLPLKF